MRRSPRLAKSKKAQAAYHQPLALDAHKLQIPPMWKQLTSDFPFDADGPKFPTPQIESLPSEIQQTMEKGSVSIKDIVIKLQQPVQDNIVSSTCSQLFVHRPQNNNNNNNSSNVNHSTLIPDLTTTSNQVLENQLLSLV